MPKRVGPKNNQETAPEMPSAKSMRPGAPPARLDSGVPPVSGEKPAGTSSGHADFLDEVTQGSVRLLGEEKRRGDVPFEPGIRRIQYGAAVAERVVLLRWSEDNAGHWHKSEMSLPLSAVRALTALLER
jgi:hypothetical protein